MSNRDAVKESANRLARYAATCRMENTLEWMEGLATRLNEYLQASGDDDRVQTFGYGFEVVKEKDLRNQ